MKSHKSREISSKKSPRNKTLTDPPPPPSTPSRPPPPNPSMSSPDVGSDSLSNRRRSSRLAGQQEEETKGQGQGQDLIESGEKSEVRVLGGSSNSVRRSTRIASKVRSGGEDSVPSVGKRKNVILGSKSEKVRVLDFGVESDGEKEKDKDSDSDSVVDLKEVVVPDLPTNSGTLRRRSQRLALNSGVGESVAAGIGDDGIGMNVCERMEVPGGHNLATGGTKRRSPRISHGGVRLGEHHKPEISQVGGTREYSFMIGGFREGAIELDLNLTPDSQEKKMVLDLNLKPEEQAADLLAMGADDSLVLNAASALMQLPQSIESERAMQVARWKARSSAMRRERFQDIARERASHFAHFRAEEDDETNATAPTSDGLNASEEIEDWPGPFSTAMKIIKDRSKQLNVPRMEDTTQGASSMAPVIHWVPLINSVENCVKRVVPSLQDLCLEVLSKNAEAIASLKYVPSEIKNRLTQMLCCSGKMDSRFMDLLVEDSPEVVRVRNCSWLTEEQITKTFDECDTTKLSVLQLDLCGRCMTDYVMRDTLARSPNCLPALVAISLKGACRLTDTGLHSLVASSPFLRSINLSQCSLISSVGIDTIASRLGLLLRELYLDDCQGIDAMLILPSLKKLRCLEVLSVADIQTVCDDFVCHFVTEQGSNMKELCLANCDKLTDRSVKAIAENCSSLCALNLSKLRKLTDISIAHLANGCSSIQNLKLCYIPSSDEAIAAFLETSGQSLKALSLNSVKKVGPNTALSLAKNCTRNLQWLDISWCRSLKDEALGYIADSCLSLRVIKLFGCTQITNVFVNGHSNHQLQIIGMKLTPILEHLVVLDPQDGPLRYS